MTLPTTQLSALLLTILGLIALGSWINALKLTRKWRFELFYFDLAIGFAVAAAVAALTLGTLGSDGFTFLDDLLRAGKRNMAYAIAGGILLNLGTMLLVGGVTLIGIAIAFPMGLGTALIVSSLLGFVSDPPGNSMMGFIGLGLVALALVTGTFTYRLLSMHREIARMKAGEHRTLKPSIRWRGMLASVIGGLLIGGLKPLLTMATASEVGLGPYSVAVMFAAGILFSTFVANLYLMNLPLSGRPLEIVEYFRGRFRQHAMGFLGGVVWAAGIVASLLAPSAPEGAQVASGTSLAVLQSAPLLAALWGLLAWKEFKDADTRSTSLMALMLFLYLAGLLMLGLAPGPSLA